MKFLKVASIVFGVLLFAIAVLITYLRIEGSRLDASSKAYVDTVVPNITRNWSSDILLSESSQTMRETVSNDELTAIFRQLSKLGPMVAYEGSEGEARVFTSPFMGRKITASYVATAEMAQGHVTIDVSLEREGNTWHVSGFFVHPRSKIE